MALRQQSQAGPHGTTACPNGDREPVCPDVMFRDVDGSVSIRGAQQFGGKAGEVPRAGVGGVWPSYREDHDRSPPVAAGRLQVVRISPQLGGQRGIDFVFVWVDGLKVLPTYEQDDRLVGAAVPQFGQQPGKPVGTKLCTDPGVALVQRRDKRRPLRLEGTGGVGERCRLRRWCLDQGVRPPVGELTHRKKDGASNPVAAQARGQRSRVLLGQSGRPIFQHDHDRAGRVVADGLLELRVSGHDRAEVRRPDRHTPPGLRIEHQEASALRRCHHDKWPAVADLRGDPAGVQVTQRPLSSVGRIRHHWTEVVVCGSDRPGDRGPVRQRHQPRGRQHANGENKPVVPVVPQPEVLVGDEDRAIWVGAAHAAGERMRGVFAESGLGAHGRQQDRGVW